MRGPFLRYGTGVLLALILGFSTSESVSAGLTGEAWLQWLDLALGDARFSAGAGRLLIDGPYRPQAREGVDELLALCRKFRKMHAWS